MEIILDLKNICSADEFYELLDTKIELPDYFGYNLDALHDVLTEIRKETNISIINTESCKILMPGFMRKLKRLCEKINKESNCLNMQME